jgi:hypothetical protein
VHKIALTKDSPKTGKGCINIVSGRSIRN